MTQDEIIRMAREAGLEKYHLRDPLMTYAFDFCIERIARAAYEAGAAAEREACAEVCETMDEADTRYRYDYRRGVLDCVAAIRARGEK